MTYRRRKESQRNTGFHLWETVKVECKGPLEAMTSTSTQCFRCYAKGYGNLRRHAKAFYAQAGRKSGSNLIRKHARL